MLTPISKLVTLVHSDRNSSSLRRGKVDALHSISLLRAAIETLESRALFSTVAALPTPVIFNVKSYGATGNGVTNDEAAITAAAKALSAHGSGTLLFPAGTYRDATPGSAVRFDGISNLTVEFDGGATLLMDNLKSGSGTGNGILIQGHASNDSVIGAHIKWKTLPSVRSFGFGIEFKGYPSDAKTIENASVENVTIEGAPQAGTIFMGCSDVNVENYTAMNTLADGLHFNACRHVTADHITGVNTGDDTLAFVTYYGPTTATAPYSEPSLGEWSDSNSTATNITSTNSHANGCRISGVLNVSVSNLTVINAIGSGVEIGSSIANGTTFSWTIGGSKGVTVDGLNVTGCYHAVLLEVSDAAGNTDPTFWAFGGTVSNVVAQGTRSTPVTITPGATGLVIDPVGSSAAASSASAPAVASSPASGSSAGTTPIVADDSSSSTAAAATGAGSAASGSSSPGTVESVTTSASSIPSSKSVVQTPIAATISGKGTSGSATIIKATPTRPRTKVGPRVRSGVRATGQHMHGRTITLLEVEERTLLQ